MTSPRSVGGPPLHILTVCTGNLCRSPLAAQLLRARLRDRGVHAVVTSAGTLAGDGEPMDDQALIWSRRLGGDPTGHTARYLNSRVLGPVDLVLGMAREHRRAAVDLRPAITKSAFTLTEFARLAAAVSDDEFRAAVAPLVPHRLGAARLRAVLPLLARARSAQPPINPSADDIEDPIGRDAEAYERCAVTIDAAVDDVVRVLVIAGRSSPESPGSPP